VRLKGATLSGNVVDRHGPCAASSCQQRLSSIYNLRTSLISHLSRGSFAMNPYESRPDRIPSTDRYAEVPLYGRYFPSPTDFRPDTNHVNSATPESIEYWSIVLQKCTEINRIYKNQDGGRDVFALGTIIIKSSRLKNTLEGRKSHRDYSYADANEVEAISLARKVLGSIKVPQVYFATRVFSNLPNGFMFLYYANKDVIRSSTNETYSYKRGFPESA
jgi:hypothetical protein